MLSFAITAIIGMAYGSPDCAHIELDPPDASMPSIYFPFGWCMTQGDMNSWRMICSDDTTAGVTVYNYTESMGCDGDYDELSFDDIFDPAEMEGFTPVISCSAVGCPIASLTYYLNVTGCDDTNTAPTGYGTMFSVDLGAVDVCHPDFDNGTESYMIEETETGIAMNYYATMDCSGDIVNGTELMDMCLFMMGFGFAIGVDIESTLPMGPTPTPTKAPVDSGTQPTLAPSDLTCDGIEFEVAGINTILPAGVCYGVNVAGVETSFQYMCTTGQFSIDSYTDSADCSTTATSAVYEGAPTGTGVSCSGIGCDYQMVLMYTGVTACTDDMPDDGSYTSMPIVTGYCANLEDDTSYKYEAGDGVVTMTSYDMADCEGSETETTPYQNACDAATGLATVVNVEATATDTTSAPLSAANMLSVVPVFMVGLAAVMW